MALCRAPQASHMLGGFAGRVFRRFVEHKVELVKMEAEADVELQCKFHDSAYLDEQLVSVACLGRFDAASALPMLSHAVEERVQRLRHHAEHGPSAGVSPHVVQEELFWLIRTLGHLLADAPSLESRETPSLPGQLVALSLGTPEGQTDWVVEAVRPVMAYVEFENVLIDQKKHDQALSPFLAETVCWFLQRWAASYLMPDMSVYARVVTRLFETYGPDTEGGRQALEFLLRKVVINTFRWREELSVSEKSCELVQELVRNKRIRAALPRSAAWWDLLRHFAEPHTPLFALP
eukprot:272726_1